jgi:hypothetical protein
MISTRFPPNFISNIFNIVNRMSLFLILIMTGRNNSQLQKVLEMNYDKRDVLGRTNIPIFPGISLH